MAIKLPICWNKSNIGKAISLKAKLDEKQTHYFLACHSPMEHIQDVRAKRVLTEEQLYKKIMGSGQRDIQAVIYGDPGTGKSHLIHWLKLRCDSDLESDSLKNIVSVLIERRSGSLKDALEQMIDQLGKKFEKYLDPVRKAIERISESTARQLLANQLSIELGPGWNDRGRDPLPRLLRELGQACRAKGFGGWLCRDDGVINRTIKLLTEASDVQERETRPQFDQSDFKIPASHRGSRENSLEVLELIDELDDSKTLRDETAAFANEALRHAVVEMIGLSGANLRKVFDVVRKDLQDDGKQLALFVEDVSAMAELDVEVVNALEPQDRQDLCPLTAVLGMTRTGFSHLRGNQKDRIEILACVDGDTTQRWSQNRKGLAQFTARYLNATRLDESEVLAIAKHRREHGGDIHVSKCTNCKAITDCHARFGKVQINDVDVGLYPLSIDAPFRMLDHIERDDASDIAPNQRGLLIRVLSPVLSDVDSISEHRFPHDASVSIAVSDPLYWTELLQNYCGGWGEENRRRLLYLTELWIDEVESAIEAAKRLLPFLEPMGFPKFSKETPAQEETPESKGDKPESKPGKSTTKEVDKAAEKRVNQILQSLRAWNDGEDLARDRDLRQLVANFLRRSIPWDSERDPPLPEWKRLVSPSGRATYDFVLIEGQVAKPATTQFFIDQFPRNEETRELLEALVRFEYLGKKSWDFPTGEHHKRVTERWLRNHSISIVNSVQPILDTQPPVASAIELLCLVATIRNREKLPQSAPKLIDEVFADRWETTPITLSKRWTELVADMESRHGDARHFVTSELAIVQGRTGGFNFIDPLPVIETATEFHKQPKVQPIPDEYFENFWKTRYFDGLRGGLKPYAELTSVLDDERAEMRNLVEMATQILANGGFDTSDLKDAFVSYCQDLEQLVEVRKSTFPWPHDEFDSLYKQGVFSEHRQSWGFALEKAAKVAESGDVYEILLFDPHNFTLAVKALQVVEAYLTLLDQELALQESEVKKGGDPKELERAMLEALSNVAELAPQDQEAISVVTQ
jgi:hypothetical protein